MPLERFVAEQEVERGQRPGWLECAGDLGQSVDQATSLATESGPVVISSGNMICGSLTSVSAMNKRCRWPPDSSEKCAFHFPARINLSN